MYNIKDIILGIYKMYSFTYSKTCTRYDNKFYSNFQNTNYQAGFEDDIVTTVDISGLLGSIKNLRKRHVFIYRCLGYDNWEIAIIYGKSEKTIQRDYMQIKRRFTNEI
jgi:hypothetical protein